VSKSNLNSSRFDCKIKTFADFFSYLPILSAFVPFKDDKLESDMLKDVAHADVAKNETIDDADANYDDYYDVS
jgi:hypothetical protein